MKITVFFTVGGSVSSKKGNLSLRKRTSLCQRILSQLENKISSFYSECAKFLKIGKYPFPLIGNVDETPVFFEMVPERSIQLQFEFQFPKGDM